MIILGIMIARQRTWTGQLIAAYEAGRQADAKPALTEVERAELRDEQWRDDMRSAYQAGRQDAAGRW